MPRVSYWAATGVGGVGLRCKAGPKGERKEGGTKKTFVFFKIHGIKFKFEFKQQETLHQY
jgi:hypothetical protein